MMHNLGWFLLAFVFAACATPPRQAPHVAVTHVTVIDVEAGARLADHTVVVEGDRITAVGPSADVTVPDGATVVDGTGRYVIPGLWDMHVHAARDGRARRFWPLFLAHGVTGVRETGSYTDSLLAWRAEARRHPERAPRIVWSSPMLDGDPPLYAHGRAVRTPAEARSVVAEMQAHGFDYLKVYSGLSRAAFLALADEARRRGVVIAGEVPDAVAPAEAARGGMRTFEHLWNLFESCVPGAPALRDSLRALSRADAPESARRPVREAQYRAWLRGMDPACRERLVADVAGVWQAPTLVINRSYSFMDSTWTDDPRRRWVPSRILVEWDTLRAETLEEYGPLGVRAWRARYRQEADLLRRMAEAGVGVLAGSDASDEPFVYPGASLHDELALLVEAGLTPLQALQAATLNPARALGREADLGSVEAGKLADLVLLDADPLVDIGHTTRIHAVVLNGRLLTRADLDRLLADAEAAAQSE